MKVNADFWFVRAALIVVCLTLSGCGQHQTKYFDYKYIHKISSLSQVDARLLGKYSASKDGITEMKSPYELIFGVSLNNDANLSKKCYILLKSISLISLKNHKIVFYYNNNDIIYLNENKYHEAIFNFKDLNLDYQDYNLNVEFQISPECLKDDRAKDVKEVILMERDYREEKLYAWQELLKN